MRALIHIVINLGGEDYSPELNDDQMTNVTVVAKDLAVGEWPGEFVRAALIDYAAGSFKDLTKNVLELIEANSRRAA